MRSASSHGCAANATGSSLMSIKKQISARIGTTAVLKRSATCEKTLRRVLSGVSQIDAVFFMRDDTNVLHVFSVIREFQSKLYTKLLSKEAAIEKRFPEIAFEFH